MNEVIKELKLLFPEQAEISTFHKNRIELDVTTTLTLKDWYERMKDFQNTDNEIPHSWIRNNIRIVLFYGNVKKISKANII